MPSCHGRISAVPSADLLALTSTVMKPLGIMRIPVVTSIRPKVQYMMRRAPTLSDIQPPSGRSSDAGKMNSAVRRPACHSGTS